MNREILILNGPIQSGKTSFLQNWIREHENIAGVLTPVTGGIRFFYNIVNGIKLPMNAAPGESEIFMVGRFIFSAVNFISISKQIADSLAKGTFQTILLDEIGPLELKQQKGFYNLLSLLLKDISTTTRLVLVARESCLADLMLFLQQSGYKGIPCTTGNFETMFEQRNNQDC